MQNIESMPRPEIILVADTVAREKNIDKEDVFQAMEIAIQKAGRSKYGFEHDIRANIDRKTGAITLARYREVVADDAVIENEVTTPTSNFLVAMSTNIQLTTKIQLFKKKNKTSINPTLKKLILEKINENKNPNKQ